MPDTFILKKSILLTILILFSTVSFCNAYENIGVSVSVKGHKSFKIKKQTKLMAEKQAISNYLKRVSPGSIGGRCEKSLIDDRAALILRTSSQGISQIGDHVEASYLVRVDDTKINRRLEELGCGAQSGAVDVVMLIMEEPPSQADISMILNGADASGTRKLRGLGPFVVFYSSYQRAIRDSIIAGANKEGLKLTRLDTLPEFERMKMSDDDPMVGVYFDTDSEEFAINHRLLKSVESKFSQKETIILYYRISSLYFDQVTRKLKATIAISLHDINTGETKSVGSQDFMVIVAPGQPGMAIRDGLSEVAANAATLLMNEARIEALRMASKAQNKAMKSGSGTSVVKLQLKSKRNMYRVKTTLSAKTVTSAKIENNYLVITLAKGISVDDFVFGELLGTLDKMGIKIADKNIKLSTGNNLITE